MTGNSVALRTPAPSAGEGATVAWKSNKLRPAYASPLYYGGRLYAVNNTATLLNCFDMKSGEVLWRQRVKGPFSASPVAGDGKVYMVNEDGLTTVVADGPRARRGGVAGGITVEGHKKGRGESALRSRPGKAARTSSPPDPCGPKDCYISSWTLPWIRCGEHSGCPRSLDVHSLHTTSFRWLEHIMPAPRCQAFCCSACWDRLVATARAKSRRTRGRCKAEA